MKSILTISGTSLPFAKIKGFSHDRRSQSHDDRQRPIPGCGGKPDREDSGNCRCKGRFHRWHPDYPGNRRSRHRHAAGRRDLDPDLCGRWHDTAPHCCTILRAAEYVFSERAVVDHHRRQRFLHRNRVIQRLMTVAITQDQEMAPANALARFARRVYQYRSMPARLSVSARDYHELCDLIWEMDITVRRGGVFVEAPAGALAITTARYPTGLKVMGVTVEIEP